MMDGGKKEEAGPSHGGATWDKRKEEEDGESEEDDHHQDPAAAVAAATSFVPGPLLSLKDQIEKDKEDESLRRWKEKLLGCLESDLDGQMEPEVKFHSVGILSSDFGEINTPLPIKEEQSNSVLFTLREGSEYRLKLTFSVLHNIVSGLAYTNIVWKAGLQECIRKEEQSNFVLLTLREGSEYRLKLIFSVLHNIVSGLAYTIYVIKGERLSPLATRRGEARPRRLFPARLGVATAAPPLLLRFRKSRPLETYVTFANRDAAAQVQFTRLLFSSTNLQCVQPFVQLDGFMSEACLSHCQPGSLVVPVKVPILPSKAATLSTSQSFESLLKINFIL
ncbi:hypothetical protein MTR67_040790 [Solanum verrucosum]|uniref:Rho GDP-dissociation inhibitor 1 n=1 Tax=Solanum verrucosum TaxID=315347 RepID=A0AAF0ZS16_SOLVR|nr:hypothetical protein MTR67_040790 [Solanum verrucosum]